jgi:hypothetical protein
MGFQSAPNSNSDAMRNCPLDPYRDQIIISVYSVSEGEVVGFKPMPRSVPFPLSTTTEGAREITTSVMNDSLKADAPSTGYLVVELFYNYDQRLALPWVRAFIPDPVRLHTYAIMPLVSAEPQPEEEE